MPNDVDEEFYSKLRLHYGPQNNYPFVYDIDNDLEVPATQWDIELLSMAVKHYGQISHLIKEQRKEIEMWLEKNPKPTRPK